MSRVFSSDKGNSSFFERFGVGLAGEALSWTENVAEDDGLP